MNKNFARLLFCIVILFCSMCSPDPGVYDPDSALTVTATPGPAPTPLPARPLYSPGELVDYTAQTGDTLPALAAHFNTSIAEIRAANPIIPEDATTMPPGMPMKIPVYYRQFWGTPFKIIPDSLFINGPPAIGFDTESFVQGQPGWLKDYRAYAGGVNRTGAGIVDLVAVNFSVNPKVLLALLEYQTRALSDPKMPEGSYLLGYEDYNSAGVYLQLVWAANLLNNGFYGWRTGRLTDFYLPDSLRESPDPWQNAATVGIQYYFAQLLSSDEYQLAIGPTGYSQVVWTLFGNPWEDPLDYIPVSLQQPLFTLPFSSGVTWAFTGGPHSGWGRGDPLAAIDFAPASSTSGCYPTEELALALADGIVARVQPGGVILDLDGDGDERTGWTVFYLHIATIGRAPLGTRLTAGDPIGFPSCEGGTSTGTHIHIARKYMGEWIPADGAIPFNLDGWVAVNGTMPYQGMLVRNNITLIASESADITSQLQADQ